GLMGSRERRRTERRKRKRRSSEGQGAGPSDSDPAASPSDSNGEPRQQSFQERMSTRSAQRNAEARAALEPLAGGERPRAVAVGAVISALIAIVFTVSAVIAIFSSAEVQGREPSPLPLAIFAVPLWLMAWGMWRARYWAVLGFQMLLVLVMLSASLALVGATTVIQVIATMIFLFGAGALFYFMIRAMARLQMPERPGA
ncbi:MAG: hypothetical protein M3M99_07780, partial [Actinomycetota bacterium]|nr:hypothetical protein [Actinomycetota bacterium]